MIPRNRHCWVEPFTKLEAAQSSSQQFPCFRSWLAVLRNSMTWTFPVIGVMTFTPTIFLSTFRTTWDDISHHFQQPWILTRITIKLNQQPPFGTGQVNSGSREWFDLLLCLNSDARWTPAASGLCLIQLSLRFEYGTLVICAGQRPKWCKLAWKNVAQGCSRWQFVG